VSIAIEHLIYRLSVFCSIKALVARQKWSLSCRDARAESRERLGIRAKLSNQQNGQDRLHQQGKQQKIQEQSGLCAAYSKQVRQGCDILVMTTSLFVANASQLQRHSHWHAVLHTCADMARPSQDERKKSSCYLHMQGIFLCTKSIPPECLQEVCL
jgi:hypothetical protein